MYQLDLSDERLALPLPIYAVKENDSSSRFVAGTGQDKDAQPREIAFFAPDRPGLAAVPIFQHKDENTGQWLLSSKSAGPARVDGRRWAVSALLYAPADVGKPPAGTVPLFAFHQQAGSGEYYSLVEDPRPGFKRRDRPVGLVWRNPSRLRIW